MTMYTNNKGIVLISVLFIVLILSAIGASMSNTYLLSIKRETYVGFQSDAIQYIDNVETHAKEEIMNYIVDGKNISIMTCACSSG